ncbi:hypothetical protein TIFTF001_010572 [Ficus carica]|uniref:Uncharacterized protein n=1 Tax=Ficus carica TaxID=3494 RepID=A0AA87ZXY2_FICCA|nr:hypothetical protein TIFTF001_010572 [Ficus carica]
MLKDGEEEEEEDRRLAEEEEEEEKAMLGSGGVGFRVIHATTFSAKMIDLSPRWRLEVKTMAMMDAASSFGEGSANMRLRDVEAVEQSRCMDGGNVKT